VVILANSAGSYPATEAAVCARAGGMKMRVNKRLFRRSTTHDRVDMPCGAFGLGRMTRYRNGRPMSSRGPAI
jgi:hypothetical protein